MSERRLIIRGRGGSAATSIGGVPIVTAAAGTAGKLAKFTAPGVLGDSIVSEASDILSVIGSAAASTVLRIGSSGLGLSQPSAGVLAIGTGAAGSVAGILQAAQLQALGAGAASVSPLLGSGAWNITGTGSNCWPYLLIQPAGVTSATWSTTGTAIGVNAASGFAGNLLDLQLNGASKFLVTAAGVVTTGGGITVPNGSGFFSAGGNIQIPSGAPANLFYGLTTGSPIIASQFRSSLTTPASAAATGVVGTMVFDAGFIYTCIATNTWTRVATATW